MTHAPSRSREIVGSALKVGIATVASLLGWVVAGKILAVELGAAGVGVFGLLRQLLQNLNVFSTFNGSNALVQGLARRTGPERDRYVHSVGRIYAVGSLFVAIGLFVLAPWLGQRLIPHPQATALLRWLAFAVVAVNAQNYSVGVLNGHRAVNDLVRSQLLGPLTVLALAYPVSRLVRSGQPAGLVLMLFAPGAVVAISARIRMSAWQRTTCYRGIDRSDAASFFRMSVVMIASGLLVTGTQYLLNRIVAERLGLEQSGIFWVAWTLSMTYVTLVLGSYGTYYMPALSALTDRPAQHALIRDYLQLALVAMPVLVSLVMVVKPWIVLLMFSEKLLPSLTVMRWMLIGDFFKGIAWVLAFPMLAFNEMRWFFWTEVAFSAFLLGGASASVVLGGGVEGVGMAFMLLYASYLVVMCLYIRWTHGFRVERREVVRFLGGLALVTALALLTWHERTVTLLSSLTWFGGSGLFLLASIRRLRWPRSTPAPTRV